MATEPRVPAILFVCLGNICRSPLAEAALRQEAELSGLDIQIDSAGTENWHSGKSPDPRAQATALRHGIDIANFSARQIVKDDFYRFSHIFALDANNLRDLKQIAPDDTVAQLMLLLDLVEGFEGRDVADPYYGPDEGFEKTWDDVTTAARAFVRRLMA